MSSRTDEIVFAALEQVGIPGARRTWPMEDRPPKPRWRYELVSGGEVYADGTAYATLPRYRVTLEADVTDYDLIGEIDDALSALGPCAYGEEWDEESDGVVSVWDFTVCEG